MIAMRTTLTLDDDVAVLLREEAERCRLPFKEIVNRTLRLGLRGGAKQDSSRVFRVRPHDFRFKPGVDLDRLNQLADELEAEAIRDRLARDP